MQTVLLHGKNMKYGNERKLYYGCVHKAVLVCLALAPKLEWSFLGIHTTLSSIHALFSISLPLLQSPSNLLCYDFFQKDHN